MCRTKYPALDTEEGRKESMQHIRKWVKKGKAWAMNMLGDRYSDGVGGANNIRSPTSLYSYNFKS